MRRTALALVATLALLFNAVSNAAPPSGPESIVRLGVDALRNFGAEGGTREQALALLKEKIAPLFDFDYMTDYTLGPLASQLKAGKREMVKNSIREHFLTTLAGTLTNVRGRVPEFTVRATRARGTHEAVVHGVLSLVNGPTLPLSFRFYLGENGWRVFDVVALNSSALLYYRQMMRQQLTGQYR